MTTQTAIQKRAAMVPHQVRALAMLLTSTSPAPIRTTVRIAGGAVRDMLLGVQPKDWDLATTLLPEVVMKQAKDAGLTVIPTGLQHGTVTVMMDGMALEITTLRADVETDGRHADVEFITDWKEDAKRRDLTMNALFMDVDGMIFDYVGGMDDLKAGVVRFVGDSAERITEDYLRILRFFRFAGRMKCEKFDPVALSAIHHLSPNLNKISGERVWMEMSKILTGHMLRDVLIRMERAGVLAAIGIPKTNIPDACKASEMNGSAETILAALVSSPAGATACADAWKLSKREQKVLHFVASHAENAWTYTLDRWKTLVICHGKELVTEAMCLTTKVAWVQAINDWVVPVFPLTGADVLATGVKAGPKVGIMLDMCKSYWVGTHYLLGKDEMIELIRRERQE